MNKGITNHRTVSLNEIGEADTPLGRRKPVPIALRPWQIAEVR
jgi:hypothetical protein